jgi:mono/diheme cytochrome c family protein
MGRFLFGLVVGIALIPLVVFVWLHQGHPPVAVADPPLPFERAITHVPLNARIHAEMVSAAPLQVNENNLVAGAEVYRDQCAVCHGFHGKPSLVGGHMFPGAPQLMEKHRNSSVVGVSDDPPPETYWKVANGIRLTGMPAFSKILSENEMWQVTLLLANAVKPLPPAAVDLLTGQAATTPPNAAADAIQRGKSAALAPLPAEKKP